MINEALQNLATAPGEKPVIPGELKAVARSPLEAVKNIGKFETPLTDIQGRLVGTDKTWEKYRDSTVVERKIERVDTEGHLVRTKVFDMDPETGYVIKVNITDADDNVVKTVFRTGNSGEDSKYYERTGFCEGMEAYPGQEVVYGADGKTIISRTTNRYERIGKKIVRVSTDNEYSDGTGRLVKTSEIRTHYDDKGRVASHHERYGIGQETTNSEDYTSEYDGSTETRRYKKGHSFTPKSSGLSAGYSDSSTGIQTYNHGLLIHDKYRRQYRSGNNPIENSEGEDNFSYDALKRCTGEAHRVNGVLTLEVQYIHSGLKHDPNRKVEIDYRGQEIRPYHQDPENKFEWIPEQVRALNPKI